MNNIDVATKRRLLVAIIGQKEQTLQGNRKEYDHKVKTRNEAGGAMISRYDTFKEEAEYSANAIAEGMQAIGQDIARLNTVLRNGLEPSTTVVTGSIFEVEAPRGSEYYFFLPGAGGTELEPDELDGEELVVITPHSPIGQIFLGQEVGFETEFRGRKLKIVDIC